MAHAGGDASYLLSLMSDVNRGKVAAAQRSGRRVVGTVYRRTRPDEDGGKRQRAEVRFDDVAGCLRTPAGGSSRQTILVVEGETVRSRLLSPREAARLMGLRDDYRLPERYNDAYHVCGDGVCVPVVRYLAATSWSRSSRAAHGRARRRGMSDGDRPGVPPQGGEKADQSDRLLRALRSRRGPIYVGQSVDGIRSRVNRHLTSARSDIIANRQIDVWEIAWVWAYPVAIEGRDRRD